MSFPGLPTAGQRNLVPFGDKLLSQMVRFNGHLIAPFQSTKAREARQIPGSKGARKVVIVHSSLIVEPAPILEAHMITGCLRAGKNPAAGSVADMCLTSDEGVFQLGQFGYISDSALVGACTSNPAYVILPDDDGEYYITAELCMAGWGSPTDLAVHMHWAVQALIFRSVADIGIPLSRISVIRDG